MWVHVPSGLYWSDAKASYAHMREGMSQMLARKQDGERFDRSGRTVTRRAHGDQCQTDWVGADPAERRRANTTANQQNDHARGRGWKFWEKSE